MTALDWLESDTRYAAHLAQAADAGQAAARYGIELFQTGDAVKALEVLEAATMLAPAQALYWGNYGTVLAATGQRKAAVEMFNRSLSIEPDQYRIWLNLANTLMPLGKHESAEEAYRYALNDPGTRIEALTGLGQLAMGAGEFDAASTHFRRAKSLGGAGALLSANIGASAFQRGHVGEALVAYEEATALAPDETGYRDNALFLRMLHGVLTGSAEEAVTAYAKPLSDDEVLKSAFRRGLPFLTSFAYLDAARALAAEWLGYYPKDIEARYLSAALNGAAPDRAPRAYVTQLFDRLADTLNDRLLGVLGYQVPKAMEAALEAVVKKDWTGDLLDAGCGTGILGQHVLRFARSLTGVDLSSRMLEHARARNIYSDLVQCDLVEYLTSQPIRFDVILAADVLIYKGKLDYVFTAAHQSLKPDGLFVFDVETMQQGTYELQPGGRFSHAPDYIKAMAGDRFKIIESNEIDLRRQADKPVAGRIYLMKRK